MINTNFFVRPSSKRITVCMLAMTVSLTATSAISVQRRPAAQAATATVPSAMVVPDIRAAKRAQTAYDYSMLMRFARAFIQVRRIRTVYDPQIDAAHGEAERISLQEEARAAMHAAVENSGLNSRSYNRIARKANTDPRTKVALTQIFEQFKQMLDKGERIAQKSSTHSHTQDDDTLELPNMEITRPHVTKLIMDAEIQLALQRPRSADWRDRNVLICRKSGTATLLPRLWCNTNKNIAGNVTNLDFDKPLFDVDGAVRSWRIFYDNLPNE